MLENSHAYSGFAVKDLADAKDFYGDTLGLKLNVLDEENGLMELKLAGDRTTLVYQQPDSNPASYTILNFPVDDLEATVDELASRGVSFERYDAFEQDERGIAQDSGPGIAWFKDPSGNVLSIHRDA
jgi:catechol 2,3-dioxygenase-like lactoylglutathione lyase family enzyme